MNRWLRLLRAGLSPRWTFNRFALRRKDEPPALKGRLVEGADPELVFALAREVWGGEYDRPGYVPGPGDRVVDIGGNVGVFAVLAASRGAQVDAYEPHPDTYRYLEANAARWPGVNAHNAAVLGVADQQTVALFLDPDRDSRHTIGGQHVMDGTTLSASIEVPALSFADVIGGGCDLLKLDAEGAEFDILLSSSPATLSGVRRAVVEVHEHSGSSADLVRLFRQAGFRVDLLATEDPSLSMLFARR